MSLVVWFIQIPTEHLTEILKLVLNKYQQIFKRQSLFIKNLMSNISFSIYANLAIRVSGLRVLLVTRCKSQILGGLVAFR